MWVCGGLLWWELWRVVGCSGENCGVWWVAVVRIVVCGGLLRWELLCDVGLWWVAVVGIEVRAVGCCGYVVVF